MRLAAMGLIGILSVSACAVDDDFSLERPAADSGADLSPETNDAQGAVDAEVDLLTHVVDAAAD